MSSIKAVPLKWVKKNNNNNNINTLFIFHKPINNKKIISSSVFIILLCIWENNLNCKINKKLKVFYGVQNARLSGNQVASKQIKQLIYIHSFFFTVLIIFDFNWFKCIRDIFIVIKDFCVLWTLCVLNC